MEQQEYSITRYSIIPSDQISGQLSFGTKSGVAFTKEEAFKSAIHNIKVNTHKDIVLKKEHVEEHYRIYFINELSDGMVLLQFAKEKKITVNQVTEEAIEEVKLPDYPNIKIIINYEKQYFFIQNNRNLATTKSIIKNFEKCIDKIFEELYLFYVIKIELITSANKFWSLVEEHKGTIKYAEFQLVSPNFLGMNTSTNTMLKQYRDQNNNEILKVGFENEKGKLKLCTEMIEELIEYISNGCGNWKLKVLGNKKTITSETAPLTIPLPKYFDENQEESQRQIQSALIQIEGIENANKKDTRKNSVD